MNKTKVILAMLLLIIGMVIVEGRGYLIHHDLYDYGLQYSPLWHNKDNLITTLLYQLIIFLIFLYHKEWKILIFQEFLWYSCFHDILFYVVWNGGVFPSGDWDWMPMYNIVGHWNTMDQILWIVAMACLAVAVIVIIEKTARFIRDR